MGVCGNYDGLQGCKELPELQMSAPEGTQVREKVHVQDVLRDDQEEDQLQVNILGGKTMIKKFILEIDIPDGRIDVTLGIFSVQGSVTVGVQSNGDLYLKRDMDGAGRSDGSRKVLAKMTEIKEDHNGVALTINCPQCGTNRDGRVLYREKDKITYQLSCGHKYIVVQM
jgi:hypothetical protein